MQSDRACADNLRLREAIDLTAGVIRIFFAQLFRHAISLVRLARTPVSERGLLQCARGNRRIVVKQGHTHERFAGVLEVSALELDVAGEKTRLGVDATFR